MSDSNSFGDLPQDEQEKPIRLSVPTRPLNQLEHQLRAMLCEETMVNDTPLPFFDIETGELENADDFLPIFGREPTAEEAMAVGGVFAEPAIEKYRLQICIAREMGSKANVEEFRAICLAENLEPLL